MANAPITGSRWSAWLKAAQANTSTSVTVKNRWDVPEALCTNRMVRFTSNGPTTTVTAMNRSTVSRVIPIVPNPPPPSARAITTPSTAHPARSSTIPAASMVWPMSRRIKRSSKRMAASTGIADTAMAVARNKANTNRWSGLPSRSAGNHHPRAKPAANGSTSPPVATPTAVPARRRINPRSVSNPVTTISSMTPIKATVSSSWAWTGEAGSQIAAIPGINAPSTEGPRITPARISPTTAGWPIRRASSPSSRAKPNSSASWMTSCSTSPCEDGAIGTSTHALLPLRLRG